MSFFGLVLRSLSQRRLSATLTAASVALGVMLVTAILVVRDELERTYERPGKGYSLVIGPPRGSELALVLNSVFHVENSAGLMGWSAFEEVRDNPSCRLAIPYAVGDSFKGHRVVATTPDVFDKLFPFPAGEGAGKLAGGRIFKFDEQELFEAFDALPGQRGKWVPRDPNAGPPPGHVHGTAEAVIGWRVFEKTGVRINEKIEATHGTEGEGEAHDHSHDWKVVGILKESGTPIDDVVFINIDSFYRIADHVEGAILPSTQEPAISSAIVFPKPKVHKALLMTRLKGMENLMVAEVNSEVRRLLSLVGRVDKVFFWVAILVVIIGVTSVMVAIYNTMSERRREIAILRALGAGRHKVMGVIVLEATLLAFVGSVLGLVAGHLLLAAAGETLAEAARFQIEPTRVLMAEPLLLLLVTVVGAIAGLVPAVKAYRTDVASNLTPLS